MDAVMAQPFTLDPGPGAGSAAPAAPAPLLPPAAPPRAPLTAPSMPSMAPLLAPPTGPTVGLQAPSTLVPPASKPLLPELGTAPSLAPLPSPVTPAPDTEVPAWARAVPTTEVAPLLPPAPPMVTPAPTPVPEPEAEQPEPTRLTAALDAAGARAVVPTSQTEAGRRAAELRAARRRRAQRIKIGLAFAFLAAIALAGPPAARWIADQVNGDGDTPSVPAAVDPAG